MDSSQGILPSLLFFFVTVVPLVLAGIAIYAVAFGIVWSPFAAAIGAFIARRRDIDVRRAALASAIYSFLSIFLWLHYAFMMWRGRKSQKWLSFTYIFAFVVWMASVLELGIFELVIYHPSPIESSGGDISHRVPGVVFVATLLTGVLAWIASLKRTLDERRTDYLGRTSRSFFFQTRTADRSQYYSSSSDANRVDLPTISSGEREMPSGSVILAPFVFAVVWTFALVIYFFSFDRFHWLNWWLVLLIATSLLWIFWPAGPWIPQRVRTLFRDEIS